MSGRPTAVADTLETHLDSEIVHLTCCRDPHPTRAFCGWLVTEEADPNADFECVVCIDIAAGYGPDQCIRGGRCP